VVAMMAAIVRTAATADAGGEHFGEERHRAEKPPTTMPASSSPVSMPGTVAVCISQKNGNAESQLGKP